MIFSVGNKYLEKKLGVNKVCMQIPSHEEDEEEGDMGQEGTRGSYGKEEEEEEDVWIA